MTDKAKVFFDACAEGRHVEVQEALREASDAQTHTLLDQDVPFKPAGYFELKLKPLHVAAVEGHGEVVKLLVEKGANLEAHLPHYGAALHLAAREGHGEVVKLLVDGGANLEAQNNYGRTALHWAAREGHGEVVKLLVDKGANLDVQDRKGATALHWAADRGRVETVKLLVDGGANLDIQDKDGDTALHVAARQGHGEVVKLLVDGGANLEAQAENGRTALHEAARESHGEVVKLLLDGGANLEAQDKNGHTALYWLIHDKSRWPLVGQLIQHVADPSKLTDRNGRTILEQAINERRWPVVGQLIQHVADPSKLTDRDGRTILEQILPSLNLKNKETQRTLMEEAVFQEHWALVKLVAETEAANVGPTTIYMGNNLLKHALAKEQWELVKVLVKKDEADLNSGEGPQPLHVALLAQQWDVAATMVEKGANLQSELQDGRSVLEMAFMEQQWLLAEIMLKNGANPVIKMDETTSLEMATKAKQWVVVGLLLQKTPDVNLQQAGLDASTQDSEGATLMDVAIEEKQWELVELIIQQGLLSADAQHKGKAVLYHAILQDAWKLATFLVNKGADLNQKGNDDGEQTPVELVLDKMMKSLDDDTQVKQIGNEVQIGLFILLIIQNDCWAQNPSLRDSHFSLLSKHLSSQLVNVFTHSTFQNPLVGLIKLASALTERAKSRAQMKDDILLLRSKVMQLAFAGISIGQMDQEGAVLNALGYSKSQIKVGSFLTEEEKPIWYLLKQKLGDFIATPQIQAEVERVFYGEHTSSKREDIRFTGTGMLEFGTTCWKEMKFASCEWTAQDWRLSPFIFFLVQFLLHCAYLALTSVLLWRDETAVWCIPLLSLMTIGYLVEEIRQLLEPGGLNTYLSDQWNLLDIGYIICFGMWAITDKKSWLAVNLFVVPCRLLHYLSIFQSTGILVAIMMRMIGKTCNFLIFYSVFLFGFAFMSFRLFTDEVDEFQSFPVSVVSLFDASLGNYDFSIFWNEETGYDWAGISLLVFFLLLSTIMALNLLIAVLSDEYAKLMEEAHSEWCLMFCHMVQESLVLSHFPNYLKLPPPLSLFTVIWQLIISMKCAQKDGEHNNTIMKRFQWLSSLVIVILDVIVHLVAGLPSVTCIIFLTGFRVLGSMLSQRVLGESKEIKNCRKCFLSMLPALVSGTVVVFVLGIPMSLASYIWFSPIAWWEKWIQTFEKTQAAYKDMDDTRDIAKLNEDIKQILKETEITEDGAEFAQVLGKVATVESQVAKVERQVEAQAGELKAQVEAQVGELNAQVEAQVGEMKAMMAQLLEAQGLATPTPAMEDSVTKEEGDGTGGLAPAGVDETKSSS